MYILPTNDREMENLCDMEQFKGRHNVIMTVKEEMYKRGGKLTIEDFVLIIKRYNKKGWQNYCGTV